MNYIFEMFSVILTRLVLAWCVPALVHGVVVAVVCVTVHFGFFLFSPLFVGVLVYKMKTLDVCRLSFNDT